VTHPEHQVCAAIGRICDGIGWSTRDLARAARISQATASRITGRRTVTWATLGKVARALGVEPWQLMRVTSPERY